VSTSAVVSVGRSRLTNVKGLLTDLVKIKFSVLIQIFPIAYSAALPGRRHINTIST